MSTSLHEGLIRTGLTVGSSSPVGASIARDYVLNNLSHLADEMAQVRMAMANSSPIEALEFSVDANKFYLLASSGTFPLPLRQSGETYAVRIRIAGSCTDAGSVSFRVVLAPPRWANGIANPGAGDPAFDYVWDATATGTAVAWLSGATLGPNASATLLTIDSETSARWRADAETLTDLDGTPATVDQCLVAVHVFVSTADTSRNARLYAAYAAEYVGAPAT